MLEVDVPYSDGWMFFRSDFVNMNVGSFSTNADGKWDDNWGACTLQDCSGNRSQSIPVPAWRSAGEMTSGAGYRHHADGLQRGGCGRRHQLQR
ncbi:hypothetical protein ACNKHT_23145 [Shigella flexneri]